MIQGLVSNFFAAYSLVHQTKCVDRPQQYGIVERKYRHLIEMSRSLGFQASLPLHYWGYCVLVATRIINGLPSSVLHNKTSFELLFHKALTYAHLRVFGCLAFAPNPMRTTHKFQPKGVPCLFLGYPHNQKGYILMNLLTKHFFVSRDVTFC